MNTPVDIAFWAEYNDTLNKLEPYRHDSYKNSKKKYINIEQDLA